MESRSNSISVSAVVAKLVWLIALVALLVYGLYEHKLAKQLDREHDQAISALQVTRASLNDMQAQFAQLKTQVTEAAASAQRTAVSPKPSPVSVVSRHRAIHRKRQDDPRWQKLQSQIAENQQAIESTRSDLANTRTELQDSIARNHSELVLLQKKGERNYYEFQIDRSKQFQRSGPLGIKLRKANTKHQFADINVLVDDVALTKKHVNLYEPVVFYAADNGRPLELVINAVTKDHIRGYVSAPKYAASDLASVSSGLNATGQAAQDKTDIRNVGGEPHLVPRAAPH